MEVTALGTAAGGVPRPGGAGTGWLVRTEEATLLVDIGNGVMGRLAEHAGFGDLDALAITHTHADHTTDLMALLLARTTSAPLTIHAPPGGEAFVDGFATHFSGSPSLYLDQAEVAEYEPRGRFEVGDLAVETFPVEHSRPAHAMRISDGDAVFAYSADTERCDAVVEAARDADLFICEASFPDRPETQRYLEGHMSGVDAGRVAAEAGAAKLVLTHVVHWVDPAEMVAEAVSAFDGPIDVAREGETRTVG